MTQHIETHVLQQWLDTGNGPLRPVFVSSNVHDRHGLPADQTCRGSRGLDLTE